MMRKLKTIEMNRLSVEAFKEARKLPLIVVLDDVRSLYNVGSVFRTADAFRVEAVYLCGITATPPHPEIHKTALGGEDSVDWRYFATTEEAVEQLHRDGCFVYSIEQVQGSTKLQDLQLVSHQPAFTTQKQPFDTPKDPSFTAQPLPFDTPKGQLLQTDRPALAARRPPSAIPTAIIFGNEVKGVKQSVVDMSEGCLEIPQFGTKHSLNVSVTAGIVIWEFARRLLLTAAAE